jgi:beta-phosphoglucomutase-like phosphatase (HAD superfamily)
MKAQVVCVDLAALFEVRPDGELGLFPDVRDAVEQWRAMGLKVVGVTTDAQRYGAQLSRLLGEAIVADQPLPRWRQAGIWHELAEKMSVLPEQMVFIAGAPMLMAFARQAGIRVVGVLRDPGTMAVLDGVWVDGLAAIPWGDLSGGADSE